MIKSLFSFLLFLPQVVAVCNFDCDDERCCYVGVSNVQCRNFNNNTKQEYGDVRPRDIVLFNHTICWKTFDNEVICEENKFTKKANGIHHDGNLLFLLMAENILILDSTSDSVKHFPTTTWFAEIPPEKIVGNKHGICEWRSEEIRCELHGKNGSVAVTIDQTCEESPNMEAFNLIALVGIVASFVILFIVLCYYKIQQNEAKYTQVQEQNVEMSKQHEVKHEEETIFQIDDETLQTMI